jgi:hypothetical protein
MTSPLDRTSTHNVWEVTFTPVGLFAKRTLTFLYQTLSALLRIPPFQSDHHTEYLNLQFRKNRLGRRIAQNWPKRAPDLHALGYQVWCNMKAMVYVYVRKMNTRETLCASTSSQRSKKHKYRKSSVIRAFTFSLVTRVRKCTQMIRTNLNNFRE